MTAAEIINLETTKTEKMKKLFELGLTRKEVAELLGVGYGFVQNVYAGVYGTSRTNGRMNYDFNKYFGIEIEAFGISRRELKMALSQAGINTEAEGYNHIDRDYWKITYDGSIRGGENAFELVSPKLKGEEGLEELKKVCRVLKEKHAKINKTCGLHVHIDANNFNLKTWKNLLKNYKKFQTEIDAFMPVSRRSNNNNYCKNIKYSAGELDSAQSLAAIKRISGDRYQKVNIMSFWRHRTVEFRQHSGTIEYDKISNWVLFLSRLVAFSAKKEATAGTWEEIKRFLTNDLIEYFENRKQQLS